MTILDLEDRIKIEGDWLWFIISDAREITVEKHGNNITDAQQMTFDFLSSDVTEDLFLYSRFDRR